MPLDLESYLLQAARWPASGRHLLAQFDDESVIVYQAYRPAIGHFEAQHGYFGGPFSLNRMSWIKPNFLWMMYRSGWGTKVDQEVTLAIRITRAGFDTILSSAVASSFGALVGVGRTCERDDHTQNQPTRTPRPPRSPSRAGRRRRRPARRRTMKLADVSVRRPVFAVMMSVALVVLGWFSYRDLGLDLMPRTDNPTVNVRTSLPGASAEEIETTVTKPIEAAVNTINGIDELRCSSNQGSGSCTITFTLERDIEAATQDVRDKVATVRFPRDTDPPVVSKIDPDAAPILTLVVFSNRSPKEITQIADKQIKQVLETVQVGVGENARGAPLHFKRAARPSRPQVHGGSFREPSHIRPKEFAARCTNLSPSSNSRRRA